METKGELVDAGWWCMDLTYQWYLQMCVLKTEEKNQMMALQWNQNKSEGKRKGKHNGENLQFL